MRQRKPWISNILSPKEGIVMRRKASRIYVKRLYLGLAMLFLLLAGCSAADRTASESTLEQDLVSSEAFHYFAQKPNTTVSGLEIIKRQTDVEAKTDRVWVEVSLSSDMFEGNASYIMDYSLYNDGWHLENVESDDTSTWSFTALRGLTEEELLQQLPAQSTILDIQTDLAAGTQFVAYERTESHTLCDVTFSGTLDGHFDQGDWYFSTYEAVASEQWKSDLKLVKDDSCFYQISSKGEVTRYSNYYEETWTDFTDVVFLGRYTATDFIVEFGSADWDKYYQKGYTIDWGNLNWDDMRYGYRLDNWRPAMFLLLGWDEAYMCDTGLRSNDSAHSFFNPCTPLQIALS